MRRAVLCFFLATLQAAEHRGHVTFGGLPVPGATVTLTQDGKNLITITDTLGAYTFEQLTDARFTIRVEMQLFKTEQHDFQNEATADWELEALPPGQIAAQKAAPTPAPAPVPKRAEEPAPIAPELSQQSADGLLINGSMNNAASSPFAQMPAFGNNRRGQRSLYSGNLGVILNNSLFDARSYSLTGQDTPKPGYSRVQGVFSLGGPIKIPRLLPRNGPNFTINYQWTRNTNAATQTGLMPTEQQRQGIFGPGDEISASRISSQAIALLRLFPEPNFTGNSRYNYQVPVLGAQHEDDLQTRIDKQVQRNFYSGAFSWQNTRTDTGNLFGFTDRGRVNGFSATAAYRRIFRPRAIFNINVNFNRLTTRTTPYFSNRENISGEAGITGNNQEPLNWGPPNLNFSTGVSSLNTAQDSLVRNQTGSISTTMFFNRSGHNLTTGFTHRRQQFNVVAQQDARGTFTFTGAAAGNDFAGFLLGLPDASSIAFGNADKYLRGHIYEAFVNDDWRVSPGLTINLGLRWEYWSPVSEKYGRLVNLDITRGFTSATPAHTLPYADPTNLAPRAAFAWRPHGASSLVIRGGYGIYYDTSIYQPIATQMSQQTVRAANSAATPLSLAEGFPLKTSFPTFAVNPNFSRGYAQIWQLSLQRDLPGALQVSASNTGNKGTHAEQEVLPNTYPLGAASPSGFVYLTSTGNSIRNAAQFQLRRRLRKGFTAELQYTLAKSIDDANPGGLGQPFIAQNWLDLRAERALSNFDQRHMIRASAQYTAGLHLNGWMATFFKEWTFGSQLTWGTGLPLTPIYPGIVPGTGFTGTLRPDYTGGRFVAPALGSWGNAGRNSITGPRQFVINSSLGRTFRSSDRISFDVRLDASNATNTPTFPSWNTVVGNAQFGLPNAANPMRTVQLTIRSRF